MPEKIIGQFLVLALYVFATGQCFCDGFQIPTWKKVIWYLIFLFISLGVFLKNNEFDLTLVLPIPIILAFLLCWIEAKKKQASGA
jgi:hypothetical protein